MLYRTVNGTILTLSKELQQVHNLELTIRRGKYNNNKNKNKKKHFLFVSNSELMDEASITTKKNNYVLCAEGVFIRK